MFVVMFRWWWVVRFEVNINIGIYFFMEWFVYLVVNEWVIISIVDSDLVENEKYCIVVLKDCGVRMKIC